jgi:hypothetical protein
MSPASGANTARVWVYSFMSPARMSDALASTAKRVLIQSCHIFPSINYSVRNMQSTDGDGLHLRHTPVHDAIHRRARIALRGRATVLAREMDIDREEALAANRLPVRDERLA